MRNILTNVIKELINWQVDMELIGNYKRAKAIDRTIHRMINRKHGR